MPSNRSCKTAIPREIERKFLVSVLPTDLLARTAQYVQQGYIAVDSDGTEVRLRWQDGACSLTVKHGSGLVRKEVEIGLTTKQFDALWPMTAGRRIEKKRFALDWRENLIVIDVFEGRLAHLILAEVEFKTVEESRQFVPPPWCLREVTDDNHYKNSTLAACGIPSGL